MAEWSNHRIQKFTSDGVFLTKWGTEGSGDGQFRDPWGVAVDSAGNVYVADTYNHRIQKFRPVFAIAATATGNGSISPSGAVTLDYGANQIFTIAPDPCYHIADVLVDGASVGAVSTYTFTNVTADHTIHTTFAIDTITATAGDNGSISPSGAVIVNCGSDQAFTITPDDCYHIADVLVDGASVLDQLTDSTYTFTNVTANHTISATFAIDTYTITATAGDNGSISPSGAVIANCGSDQAFIITPDPCYRIADVLVDGASVMADVLIDVETGVGTYTFVNIVNNHTIHAMFEMDTLDLARDNPASYDVLTTTLSLDFSNPVMPNLTCFDWIGMEVNDSGEWDFVLSNARGLVAETDSVDPSKVTIDINRDHVTSVNLAVAALANHKKVDIMLREGAFTDICDHKNEPVMGTVRIQMITHGYVLGNIGDVTGDGGISPLDAALILQDSAGVPEDEIYPIYATAEEISNWLAALGHPHDLMLSTADVSGNGVVTAFDAAQALRISIGLDPVPLAPGISGTTKKVSLRVSSFDDQKLEVSIDLNDVANVYSADMILTYDPQSFTIADVSGTVATAEWLTEYKTESGRLKISMAGASQPVADGSLVTVSFHVDGSREAVEKLNIADFRLNGGQLKTTIENLPKLSALLQNYPNPFNPETWIPYHLSEVGDVSISIYNANGQMVRQLHLGSKMPGYYVDKSRAAYWDGRNESGEAVSSGIYFYQMQAGRNVSVKKMTIVR